MRNDLRVLWGPIIKNQDDVDRMVHSRLLTSSLIHRRPVAHAFSSSSSLPLLSPVFPEKAEIAFFSVRAPNRNETVAPGILSEDDDDIPGPR